MWKLWKVKARRFVRLWRQATLKGCLAPIFNRAELFQLIQFPIFLFIVYLAIGEAQVGEELTVWWAGKMALIWAIPAWLILNAAVAPFRVWKEETEKGRWYGNRFVYHVPRNVFTRLVKPIDHGKTIDFKVMDAEPNTHVQFELEYSRGLAKALIGRPGDRAGDNWDRISRDTQCDVRVDDNQMAGLIVHCPGNSDPTTIRVKMISWEVLYGAR